MANSDGTKSIKLDDGVVGIVLTHKKATGVPIVRFIEDAIAEKIDRLADDIKIKMGVPLKNKK